MSEKKFHWRKKHNTGINVLIIDGQRTTIKPGDHVHASISELGSCAWAYEPAAPSTRKRPLTQLEIETKKHEEPLKLKSIWLNPKFRPGIGDIKHVPSDVRGLRNVLAEKLSEGFDNQGRADGEMGAVKIELKSAWKSWENEVKIDPKRIKSLREPEEPFLTTISKAQAKLNVLQSEIKELKIRLELALQAEEKASDNRAERLKHCGFAKLRDHKYFEVDGRKVQYVDGKPIFKDSGESVLEYLGKCKVVKAEKLNRQRAERAKAARERRELTEAAAV
jgi:hypothetical protein